jgi:hypothetical protein
LVFWKGIPVKKTAVALTVTLLLFGTACDPATDTPGRGGGTFSADGAWGDLNAQQKNEICAKVAGPRPDGSTKHDTDRNAVLYYLGKDGIPESDAVKMIPLILEACW